MLSIKSSSSGLTRRNFLKAGALGAAGLAAAGSMTGCSDWLSATTTNADEEEKVAYTTHQSHCSGHCSLKCTVRNGRLVMVEPNQAWGDDRFATCCLKGISEVQHIYSHERIQVPLKRIGERGTGEFTQTTWDEALDEIAGKLVDIKEQYGGQSIFVKRAKEANYSFLMNILGALTDKNTGIDTGIGNGLDPATGLGGGFASGTNEDLDWVNSKTIIHMGNNLLESKLVTSKAFFDAKEAGAHIITIDPNFSTTASKSNEWIPIIPGTDAALLLGMITDIIENKWYDEMFMRLHTSFSYLVDTESGELLKSDDSADAQYLVWNSESSMPESFISGYEKAALEGYFSVNEKTAKPVFQMLKENQSTYTLQWTQETTGIDADKVHYLAKLYATGGPASLSLGYGGGDKYENADIVGHAAIVLASITGQIGKPGASIGVFGGGTGAPSASLASWPLPKEFSVSKQKKGVFEQRATDEIKALFAPCDLLLQSFANMHETEKWLQGLELIVAAEIYHTSFVDWADYVLPVCSRLECEDEIGGVSVTQSHVRLQSKVLDPLFESKSDFYIERELVSRLGYGDLLPKTREENARYQLANSKDKRLSALTVEQLLENKGLYPLPDVSRPACLNLDNGLKTATKRLEIYYESMVEWNQALPTYEKPNEAYSDNPLCDKYPLIFLQTRTRFHIHNHFCDAEWIRQFVDPFVELNPIDMEFRSLKTGDTVQIFNDRGTASCKVQENNAVRPGTVRSYEGFWSKYMREGNLQNLTNDAVLDRGRALLKGPVIPFNDTLVEVKKA